MLRPFLVCGSSFKVKDHEDESSYSSPCDDQTSSTKSFKISSPCSRTSRKASSHKNPFAHRGLDKFSALLADVEEKKQKIYLSKNSRNISFVRFVYSSSNDGVVPIVVVKNATKDRIKHTTNKMLLQDQEHEKRDENPTVTTSAVAPELCLAATEKIINLETLKQPSFYIPAIIIFILLLLTVFGRSGAILFTTIGWYAVPTITRDTMKAKAKQGKKKVYTRKLSENNHNVGMEGSKKKELMRKLSEIKMVSDHGLSSSSSPVKGVSMKHDSGHRKSF